MPATYVSTPTLKINNQSASASLMEDILEIIVEESLHLPGMFTLVIRNDYFPARTGESPWLYDTTLTIGTSIEIALKASTTEDTAFQEVKDNTLIKGEITAIEAHFTPNSQAPIIIRGYDESHRLHRGRYNRSFQNKKDSDIVKQVIKEAGITAGTVDDTGGPYGYGDPVGYVFQENQTNMEFLRERAARNGFELFVQDGKFNFRKPTAGSTLNLVWLKDIISFQVQVSSAEQVSSVEVRAWDYQNKQAIVSTKSAQTSQVVTATGQGQGKTQSTAFNSSPKMIVVNQPVSSSTESDVVAQALFNELSGEFVQADAKAEGNPEIRPGKLIKLTEMGKYSGSYYVTDTRHVFQQRVYVTEFSVRGLRDGDLLTTIQPQTRLQPGQTLLVGIVTNNKDPKKWGRVRVKFPTLTEDHESDWARVVAIGAGSSRGFDCLPEVNDEVLVGFEHGDIHRPFVIGGMWNGKDAPPTSVDNSVVDGKVRLRTVKTRTGHTLQFVEEDKDTSKKGIYLDSVYGHKLYLNDTDKKIELKTSGNHHLLVDDTNKKIQITTSGGHTVTLDDQARKITMSATSEIELTAPQKILLKVGTNSIEISITNVTLKTSTGTVDLGPSGINVNSTALATVKGVTTTVKGDAAVTVSAPIISLG
ncbi:VgrG-related protein [Pantanalinema sp. GBBB05]|uniref:VgrG-related protein n=1 Tax=Pantanalinema sp. GBBB05 TaxID=2604139 RepID=UPI001DF37C27|nr:VgrG-related protein [Pantanalinema sp. GBBB05]